MRSIAAVAVCCPGKASYRRDTCVPDDSTPSPERSRTRRACASRMRCSCTWKCSRAGTSTKSPPSAASTSRTKPVAPATPRRRSDSASTSLWMRTVDAPAYDQVETYPTSGCVLDDLVADQRHVGELGAALESAVKGEHRVERARFRRQPQLLPARIGDERQQRDLFVGQ